MPVSLGALADFDGYSKPAVRARPSAARYTGVMSVRVHTAVDPPSEASADVKSSGSSRHLFAMTLDELRTWLIAAGRPRYRAEQIADWVYQKKASGFDQMTNLSKADRAGLAEGLDVYRSRVNHASVAADGTRKLLLSWPDETSVETVWIPDRRRNTVCVSSQVGCPVGCRFCASGLGGLTRNLTAGEIVEQAVRVAALVQELDREPDAGLGAASARLTHIVFMGMGEPLANYDEVVRAIRILNAPWGLGIGARKITLSTVGLPKQIRRLAGETLQLNLALSLHAPDDALRQELIPWGRVPIAELLDACSFYFQQTGREITLEYVLLDGVNDHRAHADQLARICKRLRCNVNLLRYNPVPGLPYVRPSSEATYAFQRRLREAGVNAHVRRSRGREIDAACGQLRRTAGLDGRTG